MNDDSPFATIGRWLQRRQQPWSRDGDSIDAPQPAPFTPISIGDYLGHSHAAPAQTVDQRTYMPLAVRDAPTYTPEEARALAPVLASTVVTAAVPEVGAALGLYDVYKGAEQMGATGGKEGKLRTVMGGINAMLGAPAVVGRGEQAAAALEAQGNSGHALIPFGEGRAIKAYHGSPHDFEQFDASKIGSGEGAQSYGHGLYFAEAPEVANSYRGSVSAAHGQHATIAGQPIQWEDPQQAAAFELWRHNGDREAAAEFQQRKFGRSDVADLLRSGARVPSIDPPGRGYEVAIKADPSALLDWDAPLSKQRHIWEAVPKETRDAIDAALEARGMNAMSEAPEAYTGGDLIRSLHHSDVHESIPPELPESSWYDGNTTIPQHTSAFLRERGIPGIKYLDQGSRRAGGTSNYVIFDPSTIEILKKYGIAGLLGGAASQQGGGR